MRYLPIMVQSAFSFLYGSFHPEELVEAVRKRGGAGVAMCDHNGLYGMVRLRRAAKTARLYALCGARLSILGGGSLVLYPQNESGHASLCRLITRAQLENPRGKPALHPEWLAQAEHLAGMIPGRDLLTQGIFWLATLKAFFRGPLFMGLGGAEISPAERNQLRIWAEQAGTPALAAPEIVALDQAGHKVHRDLTGIAQAIHHWPVEPLPPGAGVLLDDAQMARHFTPAEIKATWRIAELCPWQLPLGRRYLPSYPLPPGKSVDQELASRCMRALARRQKGVDSAHAGRLLKELKAISGFGFSDYFLLVGDIVDYARGRGIRCTVRGSAAGSIVTWLLCGGVDPVEHDLLFERFLNDGRHEPPDVDLDFDSLRRDEVFKWLMQRFLGRSAMVATVPTFRARSAVRELFISQGGDRERAGDLTDFIPYHAKAARLPGLLQKTPELAGHPLNRHPRLLADAAAISGLPRQLSVHLGGVAIGPLHDLVPIERTAQDLYVVQLDKDDVEDLGLVKMDLLGLRMHAALDQAAGFIKDSGHDVDLDRLPLDDPAVYELMCDTDTVGLFQVESPGQRGLLGRLQPRNFADLMVEISLFRPGPMRADMITPYLARRRGEEPPSYPHPILEPVLKETLGVVVFQEQVLRIAHHLAGLSYGEADGLRRAMSHKRAPEVMYAMRDKFVDSCLNRGVDAGDALLIWDIVSSFASYGFPKAHAAAFAHIAYQSAWLRVHYPLEFFLGLLNAGHVGSYPARTLLNEARRQGISILPPDLNRSQVWYSPQNGAIRVGLAAIRGIGSKSAAKIIAARKSGGPFHSPLDLRRRGAINLNQFRALDQAGLLAGLGPGEASSDHGLEEESARAVSGTPLHRSHGDGPSPGRDAPLAQKPGLFERPRAA